MASGLGEIWEEVEFWANLMVEYVDPDGKLGVKSIGHQKRIQKELYLSQSGIKQRLTIYQT